MKDPAFLFYSNDFLSGTILMSNEEVGKYIRLLCLQHQRGHLKEKDMLNICNTYNEDIFSKFKKDEEGNYYNERLEYETNKRKAYSESRRNNRVSKEKITYEKDMLNICNSYEEHMENENENINKNIILNKDNRKRGSKGKKEEEKKHFAEFVSMTNAEYDKLVSTHGKSFADQCVITLDNYKGATGKTYKSDYRAILNWVVDKVNQSTKKQVKGGINDFIELYEEAKRDEQNGSSASNNNTSW